MRDLEPLKLCRVVGFKGEQRGDTRASHDDDDDDDDFKDEDEYEDRVLRELGTDCNL